MRLLKTLVIVMGVVLVLGFGALIYIIATRITAPRPAPVQAEQPEPPPKAIPLPPLGESLPQQFTPSFGEQTLAIPEGARLSDFSAGGDRLVLRLILEDQTQQLIVIDLNTGALIGTLNLATGEQGAPATVLPPLPGVQVPPRNAQEGK